MELSFDELRKVLTAEKLDVALQPLGSGFYDEYATLLTAQRAELQTNFSHDANTRYQNNLKIFKELAERRESKIVMKALRDAKTGNVNSEGLCPHESSLYSSVLRNCLNAQESFEGIAAGKPQPNASQPASVGDAVVAVSTVANGANGSAAAVAVVSRRVHVLVDVPEFVTANGATIGPLKTGDVVDLEGDSAALLIRRQAVREA